MGRTLPRKYCASQARIGGVSILLDTLQNALTRRPLPPAASPFRTMPISVPPFARPMPWFFRLARPSAASMHVVCDGNCHANTNLGIRHYGTTVIAASLPAAQHLREPETGSV